MNWNYDNNHIIENQEMITKHQLAFNLNAIIINYTNNKNIERFYRKINRHSKNISNYICNDIYIDFKLDIKRIYDDMINGEYDETIINDCIQNIKRIIINLLVFQ